MFSATKAALSSPGELASAIEAVMEGREEPEVLADLAVQLKESKPEVTKSPVQKYESSVPPIRQPSQSLEKLPSQQQSALVKLAAKGNPQGQTRQVGHSALSEPGDLIGISDVTEEVHPSSKEEGSVQAIPTDLELFETYIVNKIDQTVSEVREQVTKEMESKVAGLTAVITKLQRRVEILEQRTSEPKQPLPQLRPDRRSQEIKPQEVPTGGQAVTTSLMDLKLHELLSQHRTNPPAFTKTLLLNKLLKEEGIARVLTPKQSEQVPWTIDGLKNLVKGKEVQSQSLI